MTNAAVTVIWAALTGDSSGIDSYVVEVSKSAAFTSTISADTVDGAVTSQLLSGLYNDTYYWRVRAIDGAGNTGANSAARGFLLDTAAGQVTLSAPADGAQQTSASVSLNWSSLTDSAGIDSYVVEVSKSSSFTSTVFADTIDGALTSDTFSATTEDSHYWRVRAIDNVGNTGANSAVRGFLVDSGVGQVTLSSPANGNQTTAAAVALTWLALTDSAGIDSYAVEVSRTSAFTSIALADTVDGALTTDTFTATDNDSFYWRVRAIDNLGSNGANSAVRGFVVDTQAGQPALSAPADGARKSTASVALTWAAVSDSVGVDSYVVEVSKSSSFTSTVVVDTVDGSVTSDTPAGLYNDTYYWRVRAIDHIGNTGANSAVRGFLVDTEAGQVVLSSPADGNQTTSASVTLIWSALSDSVGIDSYVVEVSLTSGFGSIVYTNTLDAAATSDNFASTGNDTYYWRVRAIDNLSNVGANSAARGFVIDTFTAQVTLISPADGHETNVVSVAVQWAAVSDSVGIDSYAIEVSKSGTFTGTFTFTDTLDGLFTSDTVTGLYNDTYFWRVRAIDNLGNGGIYSAVRGFIVDTVAGKVTLTSPASGTLTADTTPTVTWIAVADSVGIDSYIIEFAISPTFATTDVVDTVDGANTTDTILPGLNADTYYWRVKAVDDLGNVGAYSDSFTLKIDTNAVTVTLLTPPDGHETTAVSVKFDWSGLNADTYTWQLAKTSAFSTLVDSVSDTTALLVVRTLPHPDTYFWRVIGRNSLGATDTSAGRGILLDTGVDQVAAASPVDGHETTNVSVVVSWSAVSDSVGIDSYAIEVSKSGTFTGTFTFTDTVDGLFTSDTLTGLDNDTYFWRVRAIDDLGNVGANSTARGFVVDTVVSTVTLSSPSDGSATIDSTPTLVWIAVFDSVGIDSYAVEVSTSAGFASIVFADTVDGAVTSATVTPELASDTHYWRVRAIDDLGNVGPNSSSFALKIDSAAALTLTAPNGGEVWLVGDTQTITWTWAGVITNVNLEFSSDTGATFPNVITASVSNTGSYAWLIPGTVGKAVRVRVSNAADTAVSDSSNANFTVDPKLAPPPDTIVIDSGNHQLGVAGAALSSPLRVRVVDTGGSAGVSGARVTFTIVQGSGAHLTSGAGPTTETTFTDGSGYASATLYLGTDAGVYRVQASNDSVAGKSVMFLAYADGRDVPAGGNTLGLGWRMVGPNKAVPPGWNLKSATADGGLPGAVDIFEYNNATSAYVSNTATAVRGRAYWIKDATGGRVFVPTLGAATAETISVRLVVGWNQISSGQYFYISWDSGVAFDMSNVNDTPLPQSQRLTPYKAGTDTVIQNKVYWYTGANYIYGPTVETTSLTSMQLKPMVGFWLYAEQACTMFIYPNPASPETYASEILTLAPAYGRAAAADYPKLSAGYQQSGTADADWGIQLVGSAGGVTDWQNYVGVKPSAELQRAHNAMEAPGLASGYLTVAVRESGSGLNPKSEIRNPKSQTWMAASYRSPSPTGLAWEVIVATDIGGATILTWDNVESIPSQYEAYLLGGPAGPVNLRKSSSLVFPFSPSTFHFPLTLAVGLPEFVSPFLSAPLSKDLTFVYPNPGPDAAGIMTFTYNLGAAADVSIRIYDVGGKLVKELKGTGAAGGNNTTTWDTTNKNGQKVGSGVYIYVLEGGGNKLIDKLAIVR
ncbi:T9SS type A sorting domain-containing protein, partial [bacterium]|nr:T9SS type A sorting domain-containing protein [bacterium]